jgi:hypothetical protein
MDIEYLKPRLLLDCTSEYAVPANVNENLRWIYGRIGGPLFLQVALGVKDQFDAGMHSRREYLIRSSDSLDNLPTKRAKGYNFEVCPITQRERFEEIKALVEDFEGGVTVTVSQKSLRSQSETIVDLVSEIDKSFLGVNVKIPFEPAEAERLSEMVSDAWMGLQLEFDVGWTLNGFEYQDSLFGANSSFLMGSQVARNFLVESGYSP